MLREFRYYRWLIISREAGCVSPRAVLPVMKGSFRQGQGVTESRYCWMFWAEVPGLQWIRPRSSRPNGDNFLTGRCGEYSVHIMNTKADKEQQLVLELLDAV